MENFLDLFVQDEDIQIVTDKIILTNDQAIQLAIQSFTQIDGRNWYKRKRCDSRLDAEKLMKPGEIIAESNNAVFILSKNQRQSTIARGMLNNKLLVS